MSSSRPLLFLSLLLIATQQDTIAKGGKTGLPFLQLGVGARSIGMGEAFSAIANDASGIFYNPAALSFSGADELLLMHKEWIGGTTTDFFSMNLGQKESSVSATFDSVHYSADSGPDRNNVAFGFSINSTHVSDIEVRLQPGPAEGTFGLHDAALAACASVRIGKTMSLGGGAKFLYEKIYTDEASGAAFDFGGWYRINPNLTIAVAIVNVGGMSSLRNEPVSIPTSIRLGGSMENTLLEMFDVTLGADVVKVLRDDGVRIHLGGEVFFDGTFALRSGYQIGYEGKDFSSGLGIRYGILRFDYAFVPFTNQLGNTHTFSLTFRL